MTPPPLLMRPPDSDLEVRLDPLDPSLSAFPILTGRICNRSTAWAATDITVEFTFYGANSLLPTADHASTFVSNLSPDTCAPFVVTVATMYPWQTIKIGRVTFDWAR